MQSCETLTIINYNIPKYCDITVAYSNMDSRMYALTHWVSSSAVEMHGERTQVCYCVTRDFWESDLKFLFTEKLIVYKPICKLLTQSLRNILLLKFGTATVGMHFIMTSWFRFIRQLTMVYCKFEFTTSLW